jgi:transposase
MQVATRTDTMSNIASYYGVNSEVLRRHYKQKVSGFKEWVQIGHADKYLVYPENITSRLSIDEVSLSKGELYTIVTNKRTKVGNKQCLVAVINGTDARVIREVLERIPVEKRKLVTEVSMDMARNMALAVEQCFPNCKKVIDRFHVVRLVCDAMQHLRVKLRWKAIEDENMAVKKAKERGEKHRPEVLSNGDTTKELLARSRYLLYATTEDWTANQSKRAKLLFEKFPEIKAAYDLTLSFRAIYRNTSKQVASHQFQVWKDSLAKAKISEFNSAANSLDYHLDDILNFFDNRSTNANAESFNSKIKSFRANLRGVTDVKFFLFRLEMLFA